MVIAAGLPSFSIIRMPYTGEHNAPLRSGGPDHLEQGGLGQALRAGGVDVTTAAVCLSAAQEAEYGAWHRMGLANRALAGLVAGACSRGRFVIGLLGNCTSLLGMLAGMQRCGAKHTRPRTVGLVFVDAHADFNTPETTRSGMLGGMPVAVAAGLCLGRLRRASGLEVALAFDQIVMAGVRDIDEGERDLLEANRVTVFGAEALRTTSAPLSAALRRLSDAVEHVYVHVDLDVLDPGEVPGHPLTVPGGPGSGELAEVLRRVCRDAKVAALGIASGPPRERDPGARARAASHRLILGAAQGASERG